MSKRLTDDERTLRALRRTQYLLRSANRWTQKGWGRSSKDSCIDLRSFSRQARCFCLDEARRRGEGPTLLGGTGALAELAREIVAHNHRFRYDEPAFVLHRYNDAKYRTFPQICGVISRSIARVERRIAVAA